jgi:outer membrane protein assembly factor BamB
MKPRYSPAKPFPWSAWCLATVLTVLPAAAEDWPSWGGPRGDFTVASGKLAESWPTAGPRRIWQRPLGGGYAGIVAADGRLFTHYRDGEDDVLVALDAATGAPVWEDRDRPVLWPEMDRQFGLGPNSTPLLLGDTVVGIGISGRLRAVDVKTGRRRWLRDLPADFGRRNRVEEYGYSANPLAYQGLILTLVGGPETAVVALRPEDGSVVWQGGPGGVSYAQPTLTVLAGRPHFLYFEPEGLVALDPAAGKTLWRHPIDFSNGNHLTPATRCDDHHLWVSSQFDTGGGRVLAVTEAQGTLKTTELWFTPKLKTSHWTLHCRGEFLYGSLGGNSTSQLAAVRWRTGEILWQERGFLKAQALWADDKLLFLDETGKLALARVSPEKLEVLAATPVAKADAWTLPTLVGTTVFVRDDEKILALDLAPGPPTTSPPASPVGAGPR